MKRYEKYKASGIEWLGEIPEHWRSIRIRNIATVNPTERNNYQDNCDITFLPMESVSTNGDYEQNKTIKSSTKGYTYFEKGDIIFAKITPCFENGKATILNDLKTSFGLGSTEFHVIRPFDIHSKLLYYVIKSNMFMQIGESMMTGSAGQKRVPSSFVSEYKLPLSSDIEEQGAIARYLDYVVGRVDEVIGQKGELIERLQAKRKALINEVVTRGLDPTAPTRPSGIDWLGNIPAHWKIGKLKHFSSKIGSGVTPTGGAEVYQSEGVLFIRSQNVYSDGLRIDEVAYISEDIDAAMSNSRVVNNDVLLNITGASIGRCCYVKNIGRANVNQHVCIIRPVDESLMCEYLQLVLNSDIGQIQIALAQNGGNREGLNFENLKNFIIPDISITEQKEIVAFIEERTTKIDNLVSELQGQIERLRQYKTAIISEAVTGKIDVREWQQPINN